MKYYIAIAALMVSCAIRAAESSTNCLAIYLVDTKIFHDWPTDGTGKPDGLKIISPPVLSDRYFVSFDPTHYTFVITATAAKKLVNSLWDLGRKDAPGWTSTPTILNGGVEETIPAPAPFVLEADGQPIYSGAFYTTGSSSSFAGPVILPDVEFIKTNLTGNVSFRIQLGYPGTFPGTADPRGDFRIQSAVDELFAHETK